MNIIVHALKDVNASMYVNFYIGYIVYTIWVLHFVNPGMGSAQQHLNVLDFLSSPLVTKKNKRHLLESLDCSREGENNLVSKQCFLFWALLLSLYAVEKYSVII